MDHSRTEQWAHDVAARRRRGDKTLVDLAAAASSRTHLKPKSLSPHAGSPEGTLAESPDSSELSELSEDAAVLDSEEALLEPGPHDLDDPWPYSFKMSENVWIRTAGGNWQRGRVTRSTTKLGPTREKQGYFYHVQFRMQEKNIRKDFAPLNGEIKPDTPRTRTLLRQQGWDVRYD